jgi:hypothetical protein
MSGSCGTKQRAVSLAGLLGDEHFPIAYPDQTQRQIWSQKFRSETNAMIAGISSKSRLVLYELLLTATWRSQPGGRIDLWCRQLDPRSWIEL